MIQVIYILMDDPGTLRVPPAGKKKYKLKIAMHRVGRMR